MQWRQDGKLRRILSSETGEEHTTQALEVRMRPSPSKSWSRTRPVAAPMGCLASSRICAMRAHAQVNADVVGS